MSKRRGKKLHPTGMSVCGRRNINHAEIESRIIHWTDELGLPNLWIMVMLNSSVINCFQNWEYFQKNQWVLWQISLTFCIHYILCITIIIRYTYILAHSTFNALRDLHAIAFSHLRRLSIWYWTVLRCTFQKVWLGNILYYILYFKNVYAPVTHRCS